MTELGGTRAHVCVILKSTSCPCSQSLLGVIPATSAGRPKRSCEEDPGATTCPAGVPGRAGGACQVAKKPQGHARLTHRGLSVQPPPPPYDTLGPILGVTCSQGSSSNSRTPHSELRTMGGGRNFQKALALSPLLLFLTCPNLAKPRLETSSQGSCGLR